MAVAAAAPAELVVGGVLEGRGGSAELACARTRLLALSLELELRASRTQTTTSKCSLIPQAARSII